MDFNPYNIRTREGIVATKTERLEARVDPDQRAMLEQAAALRGQSLSAFVIGAAMSEAGEILHEAQVTMLPASFTDAFMLLLDAPAGAFASDYKRLAGYEPLTERSPEPDQS